MSNPFLTEDIMMDIFTRLPAKSIGKCRCLSKSWNSHLSTSQFLNSHLIRKTSQESLIFISLDKSLHIITPTESNDENISTTVGFPNDWGGIAGSCNGMVLLLTNDCDMLLVNPVTFDHIAVPKIYDFSFCCGFGYDSSSDDYKIVLYRKVLDKYSSVLIDTFVDVYSVKSGCWKRVDSTPKHYISGCFRGVYMNGAIHWFTKGVVNSHPPLFVAFDLANEVFYEFPAPTKNILTNDDDIFCRASIHPGLHASFGAYVLDGCLCVVDTSCSVKQYIWVMKEYGLFDSWVKYRVNANGAWDIHRPLCFIGNEEIVLVTRDRKVVVCNVNDGTSKVMYGVPAYIIDGVAFADSLVSPNQYAFPS